MSTGGPDASEKTGGREQRKYGAVELFLLEQKTQAQSPGSVRRKPWEKAGGFGLQSLAVYQGHGGTHLVAVHLRLGLGGP